MLWCQDTTSSTDVPIALGRRALAYGLQGDASLVMCLESRKHRDAATPSGDGGGDLGAHAVFRDEVVDRADE